MHERLLVITDRRRAGGDLLDRVARVLAAVPPGSALVMLREKDLEGRELVELARALVAVAHRSGARLVVNDRADVALAAGADGVHLPESGFSAEEARVLDAGLVGASVHDLAGVHARGSCDYLVAGPVWDTPGKAPMGLDAFTALVAAAAPVPVFAVGGIDVTRADAVVTAGAHGVAVLRALMEVAEPERAAAAFAEVFLSR